MWSCSKTGKLGKDMRNALNGIVSDGNMWQIGRYMF